MDPSARTDARRHSAPDEAPALGSLGAIRARVAGPDSGIDLKLVQRLTPAGTRRSQRRDVGYSRS